MSRTLCPLGFHVIVNNLLFYDSMIQHLSCWIKQIDFYCQIYLCVKTEGRHLCNPLYIHVLFNMPSKFSFSFDLDMTMFLSFVLLGFLLLSSSISCGPAEAPASRWGHGGSTGIIAGGVFPLPCDCLSKCVSNVTYNRNLEKYFP